MKISLHKVLAPAACAALLCTCALAAEDKDSVTSAPFGQSDGKSVEIYTLHNNKGAEAKLMTYGATLVSLQMPDRQGKFDDIVLGYDSVDDYKRGGGFFGATIGRYGNRIAKGKFTLDGVDYQLKLTDGQNNLHGGPKGFDKVLWEAKSHMSDDGPMVEFKYVSPDGDQGFPGTLTVTAVYTLTHNNELRLDFMASTDKKTVLNLTQHTYWNLSGHGSILNDLLTIPASRFTPVDARSIPTGELKDVAGTPFDFRIPTAIGERITNNDPQIRFGHGYDHNWVIDNKKTGDLTMMVKVSDPASGRTMEVWSTEPGVQFYSGNFVSGNPPGKGGARYARHDGMAFEPQHFPDSPNHPDFPSTELKPGDLFKSTFIYRFKTE